MDSFGLGQVQLSPFGRPDALVANMVAQRGIRHQANAPRAVDYEALRECLGTVGKAAYQLKAAVHMPRIGCGLGGGEWGVVEEIVREELVDRWKASVTVYDLM
jgi:O-acetyl-ADP-ribose deacetylase (regulator of RNase III)